MPRHSAPGRRGGRVCHPRRPGTRAVRPALLAAALHTASFSPAPLHGAATSQPPRPAPHDPVPAAPTHDAYLDEVARRLVLGLKAARDAAGSEVEAYTAVIRERMGAEWPGLRRNRRWLGGERAARFRWSREEPTIVRVLGASWRDPSAGADDSEFFPGLRPERFAADPLDDPFLLGLAVFDPTVARAVTVSPLAPGSERHYRFRSGDTISVQLGSGTTLRAVAVTVIPRYASIRLLSAIMWIDPESFGLARAAFRLSKPIDRELSWRLRRGGSWQPGMRLDAGAPDRSDPADAEDSALDSTSAAPRAGLADRLVNGAFNGMMPRFEMDISTVVADYGLWETRHWLPRSVTWRGHMAGAEGLTARRDVPPPVPMTIEWTVQIEDIRERGSQSASDAPATAAEALRLWSQAGDSVGGRLAEAGPGETITITPADRRALTTSGLLPATLWENEGGRDDATIARLEAELAAIGAGDEADRADAPRPTIFDPPGKTLRLLRYNPVERLSVGARLQTDHGWGRTTLTARVGTAGPELPDVDLTVMHDRPTHRMFVSFYRTLQDGGPGEGGVAALDAYVAGRPEDFHWSHGAAVRLLPPAGRRNWLSLRLFVQQDVDIGTDERLDRVGAGVAWRPWWGGFAVGSVSGGGRASVRAVAGDHPHARAVVEGALVIPLPSRMSLGAQAAAARVWGEPAPHDLLRIGGGGHWLRGHAEAMRASRIEMARLDLQRPIRFLRLSVFADWASAGGEDRYAAGAGLVFMEGSLRLDAARGLGRGGLDGPEAAFRLHLLADTFF